jgi:multiple sugar transport system permease protein
MTTQASTLRTTPRRKAGRAERIRRARPGSHIFLAILVIYFAFPMYFLIIASTKSNAALFNGSNGSLWIDRTFSLFSNFGQLFTHDNGIYLQWLGNSALYAACGGVGSTVLAVLAGYGFAKYQFRGRGISFALLLGSVMVPLTALVVPTFVLLHGIHLTNTIWAVILPSLLNPFGVYLVRVFAQDALPEEIMDAARVDGAGELRLFASVCLPLLRPAMVTVLLLSMVATWNNYFLPLTMLSNPKLLPITVGLANWQLQSVSGAIANGGQIWNLVMLGSVVSIVPLIAAFLVLQRYWQGGLSVGSLK